MLGKIGIVIQAHMGSTRLPGKVLMPLASKPMLYHVVERAKRTPGVAKVIVATSTEKADDAIEDFCKERGYDCFRGSDGDVLSRYAGAAKQFALDTVIRVTSDCPLIDPVIGGRVIEAFAASGADYQSNVVPGERTFPRGLDTEIFSTAALLRADREGVEPIEREHVTPYLWQNKKGEFTIGPMVTATPDYARDYRLTVDYPEDYQLLSAIYDHFYKPETIVDVPAALAWLDTHPELVALNAECVQKTH